MFCRNCGKYNPGDKKVCMYCGGELTEQKSRLYYDSAFSDDNVSKIHLGVLLGIFLGLIGLLIGFFCYPARTYARHTFIKGWVISFVVQIVLSIVLIVVMMPLIADIMRYYTYY